MRDLGMQSNPTLGVFNTAMPTTDTYWSGTALHIPANTIRAGSLYVAEGTLKQSTTTTLTLGVTLHLGTHATPVTADPAVSSFSTALATFGSSVYLQFRFIVQWMSATTCNFRYQFNCGANAAAQTYVGAVGSSLSTFTTNVDSYMGLTSQASGSGALLMGAYVSCLSQQ